ncbi:hypothetical protein BO78DRAFT_145929 [Aspergillus sclerotiicarbonarius CBS 121057]|uniref:Uncharacterized protein n=1 Tax=Aspergillus sclerotiicarbonarius (strain CBS 121057 / IBT 28362) TaxID=1448318 RepID=A0A319E629_ASPSB|nr:hypothetical protein BO78DRAFT_145929 [Aspergillus sclerotiicarbonarius CBS 121057]
MDVMGRNAWMVMVGCFVYSVAGMDGLAIGMIWIDSMAHDAGFANQRGGCKTLGT